MAAKAEHDKFMLVAAIDFGTTFSGYAFSFTSSPENIIMNKNWGENIGFAVGEKCQFVIYDILKQYR